MHEPSEVPPDLAFFESQLRSVSAPPSSIDRDQLMYQAGWAAALSSQNASTSLPRRNNHWIWPTTTGVFASLAALLAIMLFQANSFLNPSVADGPPSADSVSNEIAASLPGTFDNDLKELKGTNHHPGITSPANFHTSGFPMTNSRFNLTDWKSTPDIELDIPVESHGKTSIELIREMTPQEGDTQSQPRKPVWNWFSQKLGEMI